MNVKRKSTLFFVGVSTIILILALHTAILTGNQDDQRLRYRIGCPEGDDYCPSRYDSLFTDKENYKKGEEVKLVFSNLKDFAYLVENIKIYSKKTVGETRTLLYEDTEVGEIPPSRNSWTWSWNQKDNEGNQADRGYYLARLKTNCCGYYRAYFRIAIPGGSALPTPPTPPKEPIPSTPQWFFVTPMSSSNIRLNWEDGSDNENGFNIYRNGQLVGRVGKNQTTYLDRNLDSDTTYCYRVTSFNTEGESELTPQQCSSPTPPPVLKPPSTPGDVNASLSSTEPLTIKITWRDTSDDEDGFKIYRNGELITRTGPNQTSYLDRNIRRGSSYYYRVTAYNDAGESGLSSRTRQFTISSAPQPTEAVEGFSQTQLLVALGMVIMIIGYTFLQVG